MKTNEKAKITRSFALIRPEFVVFLCGEPAWRWKDGAKWRHQMCRTILGARGFATFTHVGDAVF